MSFETDCPAHYINRLSQRTFAVNVIGLFVRIVYFTKYLGIRLIARLRGAKIGHNTILTLKLAFKANENLVIGNDVVCKTEDIDLRSPVIIKDNVIINKGVSIIRVSHYIDNDKRFTSKYYKPLTIESYSWLATGCRILPSCFFISCGSVIGAYSVVCKNTEQQGVYSGNPAVLIRRHNTLFVDLIISTLGGGDLRYYYKTLKLIYVR